MPLWLGLEPGNELQRFPGSPSHPITTPHRELTNTALGRDYLFDICLLRATLRLLFARRSLSPRARGVSENRSKGLRKFCEKFLGAMQFLRQPL